MNYAASKENLIKKLPGKSIIASNQVECLLPAHTDFIYLFFLHVSTGIKHNFQFNDLADCPDRNVFAGKLGKTVTTLEGVPVFYDAA